MFPTQTNAPVFVFAPMEGVTDAPMRQLITQIANWDWCVTEFIRINDLVPPDKVFLKKVPELLTGGKTLSGTSVSVQLLGGNAANLALSAKAAVDLGALAIDLNFGCPAPTVNRHDGGATLLKYPDRLFEIVSAVRKAVPDHIPVSAKLRLGWEDPSDCVRNAERVWSAGASWITLHARTRMAGYSPPVFWDWIGKVAAQVKVPVVANGDIWNLDDFKTCAQVTGCQAFMFGRGALADPFLVDKARAVLAGRSVDSIPPPQWRNWFLGLDQVTAEHPRKSEVLASRCKQWGNFANRVRKNDWFDRIKKQTTFESVLTALGE